MKYNCTVPFEYFSDPTDGTAGTNPYYADTWKSTVSASDGTNTGTFESASGVELNSKNAMTITSSISYGALGPNVASSNGIIDKDVAITNIGNVGLDAETKGDGAGLCTDYPGCAGSIIPHSNQKYVFVNNSTAYASGTTLTGTLTTVLIDTDKPTYASHPKAKSIYWGLKIPAGQAYGSYTGSNTINSIVSAPANW